MIFDIASVCFSSLALAVTCKLSGRISKSLPVRSGGRSCPKDTELRNENPQLAYHRTRPAIRTLCLLRNSPFFVNKFIKIIGVKRLFVIILK